MVSGKILLRRTEVGKQLLPVRPLRGSTRNPSNGRDGEGLRTAAGISRASGLRAAVGKPPKDERAGGRLALWGFDGKVESAEALWPIQAGETHGRARRRGGPQSLRSRVRRRCQRADTCCPGLAADDAGHREGELVRWPKRRRFDPMLDLVVPGHGALIRLSIGVGAEPGRGATPSKLSITSMRPPQQGHGVRRSAEEAGLVASGGAGTASSSRARAMLALHRPVASRP